MAGSKKNMTVQQIYAQYENGNSYKSRIGLFDSVARCENFFLGRQWEGVNAPDLEKPVNNIIRRIVTYAISQIVSDDVTAEIKNYPNASDPLPDEVLAYLNREIAHVLEQTKYTTMSRDWIRDAAVDGDACGYWYWDDSIPNGTAAPGAIACETVDNTRVIFGAPSVWDVQKQPYIIIPVRRMADEAKLEAKRNGEDPEQIKPDADDTQQPNLDMSAEEGRTTLLVRLWREPETGSIWCSKSTQSGWVRKPWDTGLKLYPVAYGSWDKVKNCYHGQSMVDSVIPNQIAINKLEAMLIKGVKDMAFPKIVYDATKIDHWNNRVGEAIATIGDPNVTVARVLQGAAISPQIQQLIDSLMALTKDCMGASDAALGNVRPENTSAILAIQKAAAAPLELQRKSYYQFTEDSVRIIVDMIRNYYGIRRIPVMDLVTGEEFSLPTDLSELTDAYQMVTVNVGASAYWSEITQLQTADNMLANGLMDGVTYINSVPDNFIKNRKEVLAYNERKAQMEQYAMMADPAVQGIT